MPTTELPDSVKIVIKTKNGTVTTESIESLAEDFAAMLVAFKKVSSQSTAEATRTQGLIDALERISNWHRGSGEDWVSVTKRLADDAQTALIEYLKIN